MIRILHTIDTTGPGGAETVFVNLVKGLDRDRFEPVVVIRGPGWVCDELRRNGIEPIFLDSSGSLNLKYLLGLISTIRERKIDIIQSHLLGANLYSSLAGLICRVPVVSTFHGFVDVSTREHFSSAKSRIINLGSDRIVFVSNKLRDFYVNHMGFSSRKSVTIYNGVDTSIFKPQRDDSIRKQLGLTPDNILVGSVGNIRPAKGYDYLIRAARMVIDKHPQFRFVIAGEGSGKLYEDLLDLRNSLDLVNHLFFVGFQPDIPRFLNNLDIFVLPSISEGFSISTIEAMSCGLPIVVTKSGGPEEIISSSLNCICVPNKSAHDLSEGLSAILIYCNSNNNVIDSNCDTANCFSLNNMLCKYTAIYNFSLL
jgi:glycosyltransferase involved in cell wall biosynthesis